MERSPDMNKKSICFFCSLSSLNTGMPLSTVRLIEHFGARDDYDVHVILSEPGEMSKRLAGSTVRIRIIPFVRLRSPARPAGFIASILSAIPARIIFFWYLRKHSIRLVHFADIIDMLYYPAARFAGCATAVHMRMCISSSPFKVLLRAWTALFADRVICISDAVRRHYNPKAKKAITVYNPGPDYSLFDPDRGFERYASIPEAPVTILTIGKFVEAKGHENFIALARMIDSELSDGIQFVILGDKIVHHVPYYNKVTAMIREYGLAEKVAILNPVAHAEMPRIFASSDIYVHMPNCQEGLGGTVLEAMAMRRPVVAFDSGGVAECFTNGISGYIVPHMDVKAAAQNVSELIANEQLRNDMGLEGRREVTGKFSSERHFSRIEDIYNELLGQQR
jgi:glycosyltransferase involved in cell wall biosynthesis